MIARCGQPGSLHHRWERIHGTRKDAEDRARELWKDERSRHSIWFGTYGVLTEKDAAKLRYQDGTPCYPKGKEIDASM
jgi:hypothetical protein